jgi:hypothetical protein
MERLCAFCVGPASRVRVVFGGGEKDPRRELRDHVVSPPPLPTKIGLMPVMGVSRFERFFRTAAGLDVDKDDLKRYGDFVNQKIYDLLIIGQAAAKANLRGAIEPFDLPITKGLQESMHKFRSMDEEIELQPILDSLAALPRLDLLIGFETQHQLPLIAGGISLALAQTFTVIDPNVKNPQTRQWERAFRIFNLLL